MSEDFGQMLEEQTINSVRNGDIIEGTVVEVRKDMIIMNIDSKYEGIIERDEYTSNEELDLTTVVQKGEKITAKVIKVNEQVGYVLMTYKKLAQEKVYKEFEKACEDGTVLRGKVARVSIGGLVADYNGVNVFIPASLVSDRFEKDLSKYKDQEIEFIISECNPRRRRIIGDRRCLVIKEKEEREAAALEKLAVGQKLEGTVKNLTKFGAFVDLDGIDGLLHISEMGWGRVNSPKEYVKVGDKIEVEVKEIEGNKISLTTKFEENNPWNTVQDKYPVNSEVSGKVARLADFGAFIELEPGVDALLHVSQISKERVEKPADVLKIGDDIEALVIDNNVEEKKISLSIRELEFRRRRYANVDDEESKDELENVEAETNNEQVGTEE